MEIVRLHRRASLLKLGKGRKHRFEKRDAFALP
jgi:hypothetical protein